jgi:hypothetical protein
MSCEGQDTKKWTKTGPNHGAKAMLLPIKWKKLPSNSEIA